MRSVYLEHPSSLKHETGAHPEQPARITAIERELDRRGWLGFERVPSSQVDRAVLTAVHSESHVAAIERIAHQGGGALDLDTVMSGGSFDAALHSAGGAVQMVEMLLKGEAQCVFSGHRPPGHHASTNQAMGFCLFNNVAVAATFATQQLDLDRVMILDWDVHHGNGTNDIFHSSDRVLFVSIHQWPHYPGTGPAEDVGSGAGRGYTVNLPVPPGAGDSEFHALVEQVVVPLAESFGPQLVLLSAGYDAHREDPLGDCTLSERGFAAMAASMRRACDSLSVPLGTVLEGGYALGALGRSVAATLEVLGAPTSPDVAGAAGDGNAGALVEQARLRLKAWWPALAG